MRIGLSPAFAFAHVGEKVNFEEIIRITSIGKELGFCGLQLETYNKEQMSIYTDDNIQRIRDHFEELEMESTQFIGHSLKSDIASLQQARVERGIEELKRLVEICRKLGMITVFNLPASPPPELISDFFQTYPGAVQPVIDFPRGISWKKIWDGYVGAIERCLAVVRDAALKLAIEAVPFGTVSSTDSFLRLVDNLDGDPDLGFVLDTGHVFFQREPVQTSVYKLGSRIFGTHIADNDGNVDDHWIPPDGSIEWHKVILALIDVGYPGPLDIEVNVVENPNQAYVRGKRFLERIIADCHGQGKLERG